MTRRLGRNIAGFLLAMGLAVGANASAAMAADALTLKLGAPKGDGGQSAIPFIFAQRNGYFAKEGVNVEVVSFSASNPRATLWSVFEALAKGDVDVVHSQVPFLLEQVVMEGHDFVAISAMLINPVHSVMVRPEIKNFADLKGKTIALTRPNDAITVGTRKMLELHGLGPDDVKIKDITGTPGRYQCLKSGECDAASVNQPLDFTAEAEGYRRLGITNEAGIMFGVNIVSNPWARAHQEVLARYIRGMAEGLRFASDPKNDAEMIKLIGELAKTDDTVSRGILRFYRDPKNHAFSRRGEIDMKAFAETVALEKKYGQLEVPLPAAHFVDMRYLAAAGIK